MDNRLKTGPGRAGWDRTSPEQALEIFTQKALSSPVGGQILRLFHFGSTYRGDWHDESDIDVLVVATGHLQEVQDALLDLSWEALGETGWLVEPLVYCPEAWERPHFFLKLLLEEGREIFAVDEEEERRAIADDLVLLARHYLEAANTLDAERYTREVIDLAYNAAEQIARAWLLALEERMPRAHRGVVVHFRERAVGGGHVSYEIGSRFSRALEWRSRARYDLHVQGLPSEAREVLALARTLLEGWERRSSG